MIPGNATFGHEFERHALPQMTTAERLALVPIPPNGTTVVDSTLNQVFVVKAGAWQSVTGAQGIQGIQGEPGVQGDPGPVPPIDYIDPASPTFAADLVTAMVAAGWMTAGP